MLRLENIHTGYGPIKALKGVSLEMQKGEIVTLIGGNGAGKSTFLMTVSGILQPSSGSIFLGSRNITGQPPHKVVEMGICQVPEGRRIFPRLTVLENLEMGAFLDRSDFTSSLEQVFALFSILKERKHQLGGTLSGGEQQMLAIARALMAAPDILLLDEPSLGLSPIMVSRIFRTIKEINKEGAGVTILLVEQNARAALKLSDRGYVLENGLITMQGESRELLENEKVRQSYLGE